MKTIKVGSRESGLAVAQARLVMDAVERSNPGIRTELVAMKTSGDTILDRSLDAIGGKGLFTKELEEALLDGRADICVHSYKDLPVPGNPKLPIVAVSEREDPRDVLVLPEGRNEIPAGLPIGTSSQRRRLQLAALFPGVPCAPVRGNIQTRLRKLDAGEYGALVLAAAGLKRLGLEKRAARFFAEEEIIPAACQGMLAVQARAGGEYAFLAVVHSAEAHDAAAAERAFVEALGATCASPVAAFASVVGDGLRLSGLYAFDDGTVRKGEKSGSRTDAEAIGRALARELTQEGRSNG